VKPLDGCRRDHYHPGASKEDVMASLAKLRKAKRRQRQAKMGKERKRQVRLHGTTPAFPIHPEKKD